jgi:isopentenyl-diphosphate delta-isomerase
VSNLREKRKLEHLHYALETECGPQSAGWEDIHLVHQALLKNNPDEIDLTVSLFGKRLMLPIYINAMTGGVEELADVNRLLAEIAREFGLGMAVGSQTVAYENNRIAKTFQIARKANPNGVLFANMGAGVRPEMALAAVEMLEADALQLHLNGVQELAMAEGDREFQGLADNIREICRHVSVPVIVKEVGNGLSREAALQLAQLGVQGLDTGGSGGTNFATIELKRVPREQLDFLRSWGLSTATSLLEVVDSLQSVNSVPRIHIFASGGITTSLEVIKALALGAEAIGMAGSFLRILQKKGSSALKEHLAHLTDGLKTLMLLTGAQNIGDLQKAPVVITGFTREWCEDRGINTKRFAQRK